MSRFRREGTQRIRVLCAFWILARLTCLLCDDRLCIPIREPVYVFFACPVCPTTLTYAEGVRSTQAGSVLYTTSFPRDSAMAIDLPILLIRGESCPGTYQMVSERALIVVTTPMVIGACQHHEPTPAFVIPNNHLMTKGLCHLRGVYMVYTSWRCVIYTKLCYKCRGKILRSAERSACVIVCVERCERTWKRLLKCTTQCPQQNG